MVELAGAAPSFLNIPLTMTDIPAIAAPPTAFAAVPQLKIINGGVAFSAATDGFVRSTVAASQSGAVGVFQLTISGAGVVTAAALFSTGTAAPDNSNTKCFQPGDKVTLKGAASTTDCEIEFETVNCMGAGRKSNAGVEFEMVMCQDSDIIYPAGDDMVALPGSDRFGSGAVLDPFRGVPAFVAAYKKPFPNDISPVEVGDILYMSQNDGTSEVTLGLVTGLTNREGGRYTIKFSPNVALSSDDGTANHPLLAGPYSHTVVAGNAVRQGISVFIKQADRLNGASTANFTELGAFFAAARTQAVTKISYTISNLQYQVKRAFLSEKQVSAEAQGANSSAGITVDIPTLFTQSVNVIKMAGPTNQLISTPNITKALSVLSVPLFQSRQFDLRFNTFAAPADDAESYQYQIGDTVQPERPVDLTGYTATSNNPLWGIQHIVELIKSIESAGYFPTNIKKLGTQFSLGRAFARKGMYFNLKEAGDLSLRMQYGGAVSDDKLVTHFVSHIRSIFINKEGMQVSN